MVFTKKVTKAPAVMVETKKMSAKDTCSMNCCANIKHLVMFVLVIINTLMIGWILLNQTNIESNKVGGGDNYKMVREIYKSEAFKAQQKQQIEQALQMYQGGAAAQQPTVQQPTAEPTPEAPVVAQ